MIENAHCHNFQSLLTSRSPPGASFGLFWGFELRQSSSWPPTDRGRVSEYPFLAARSRVAAVHGQPCSRAHFSTQVPGLSGECAHITWGFNYTLQSKSSTLRGATAICV